MVVTLNICKRESQQQFDHPSNSLASSVGSAVGSVGHSYPHSGWLPHHLRDFKESLQGRMGGAEKPNECSLRHVLKNINNKAEINLFCFGFLGVFCWIAATVLAVCFACGEFKDFTPRLRKVLCVGWWLLKKHPRSGIPLIIYPTLMPLWAQLAWVVSAHLVWVNPFGNFSLGIDVSWHVSGPSMDISNDGYIWRVPSGDSWMDPY